MVSLNFRNFEGHVRFICNELPEFGSVVMVHSRSRRDHVKRNI